MKKYMNSMEYYKKILGSHNLTFSELNKNSMDYFSKVELCITATSQLAISRMFCGYKTIYAPFNYGKKFF